MKNYCLNIAGYKIKFESSGPELIPSKRFLSYVIPEIPDFPDDLIVTVHNKIKELPANSRRIFHAPFVEEINGSLIQQSPEFWSIWQHNSDLYINVIFPSGAGRKVLVEFSLTSLRWDMWVNSGELVDPFEYPLDGLILYYLTVINKD